MNLLSQKFSKLKDLAKESCGLRVGELRVAFQTSIILHFASNILHFTSNISHFTSHILHLTSRNYYLF